MSDTIQTPFLQLLSGAGVTGVTALLAYLWIKKDQQYTDLADKLSDAFERSATVNAKLENTIAANTKVTEKLETSITTRIFELLKDEKRK